jgi:hypothetical protein
MPFYQQYAPAAGFSLPRRAKSVKMPPALFPITGRKAEISNLLLGRL